MAKNRDAAEMVDQGPPRTRRARVAQAPVRLAVEEGPGHWRPASETEVLRAAQSLLKRRLRQGRRLPDLQAVQQYLQLTIGTLEHEVFYIVLLDGQQRLLAEKVLFRGTATQTAVYRREVVKEALAVNACAVILVRSTSNSGRSFVCRRKANRFRLAFVLMPASGRAGSLGRYRPLSALLPSR